MAVTMGGKNLAFAAVSLFLGIPILILILTKGSTWAPFGGGALPKDQDTTTPKPEDILLDQLKRMTPTDKRALTLHLSIGNIYDEAGRFSEAVEQYNVARELAMQHGEQLAIVQGALGAAYYHQGKLKKAKRELEAADILVDSKSAPAFDVLKNLANVRRDEGKLDEALELYENIYHDRALHEAVGPEAWAELCDELGEAHRCKGKSDKALMYFHQAWELLHAEAEAETFVPGRARRDLEMATCQNRIGRTLQDDGNVAKALVQYRMALKIQQKSLRPGHPHTAGTMMNIARALRDLGEPEKAMSTLEDAEKTLLSANSERKEATPEYGGLLTFKADLLREAEKLSEAEAVGKEALEVQRLAFEGDDNPEVAVTLNGLGSIHHDKKDYREAMRNYMLALKINLKTVGFENPETASSYNNLGNVYQDVGDDDNARKYYEKCLEIQKLTVSEKSPELSVSYNNIGTILFRQGKSEQALDLFEKAVQIARASGMPAESPDRAIYEENWALAQKDVEKKASDHSSTRSALEEHRFSESKHDSSVEEKHVSFEEPEDSIVAEA